METIDTQSAVSGEMVDAITQTVVGNGGQHPATQGMDTGPERSCGSQAAPVVVPQSIGKLASESTPTPPQPRCLGQLQQSRTVPATNSMSAISTVPRKSQVPAEIENALAEVRKAWQLYRCTNRRHAVYYYLEAVFALVTRWQRCGPSASAGRPENKGRAIWYGHFLHLQLEGCGCQDAQ